MKTNHHDEHTHIFDEHASNTHSTFLIQIGCVAALFCAFILVNSFLNIDFKTQKQLDKETLNNIFLENIIIKQDATLKSKYTISGRIINKSSHIIIDPFITVDFSDCKHQLDCLIIDQKNINVSNENIPSQQARNFSVDFLTNKSMQAQGKLKPSWTFKKYRIRK